MTTIVGTSEARPVLAAWAEGGMLIDAAAAHPQAERLRGRGRVVVVPAPSGDGARWVVRHYHRGGAVAALLGDRFLRSRTPRPVQEYRLLRRLRELGVPTPGAIGAAVYLAGPFYRGDLVTEWVPDSRDLAAVLFDAHQLDELGPADGAAKPANAATADVQSGMESAGRLVRLLHERGVVHPDLNIKNILLTPGPNGPRALVLDLDRARVLNSAVPRGARRRMLERFRRSVRKWERRAGRPVPGALESFDRGYHGAVD